MNQYNLTKESEKCWHGLFFGTTCWHCQREHAAAALFASLERSVSDLKAKLVASRMAEELARSLAMEECAREAIAFDRRDGEVLAEDIRCLAPLPSTLVAVEKAKLAEAVVLVSEAAGNGVDRCSCCHNMSMSHAYDCELAAALALLEPKP